MSLGIALTGCNGQSGDTDAATDGRTAERRPADSSDIDAVAAKLAPYVDCYNRVDGTMHQSMGRYVDWVEDMEAGPTGRERDVRGLGRVPADHVAKCKSDLANAAAAPKLAELEAAGSRYVEALEAALPLITEAYAYYSRQNYKDDAFAQAKSMHGPLAAAFSRFLEASTEFSNVLEAENNAVLDAHMAELEKNEGRNAGYYQLAVLNRAKALVNVLEGEDFDLASATDLLSRYEAIADEAIGYASGEGSVPQRWSGFASEIEGFRMAAKRRLRRVRDGTPYTHGERLLLENPGAGWSVQGSPDHVVRHYNLLIGAHNRL